MIEGFTVFGIVLLAILVWFILFLIIDFLNKDFIKEYIKVKYFDKGELYSYYIMKENTIFKGVMKIFFRIKYREIKPSYFGRKYEILSYNDLEHFFHLNKEAIIKTDKREVTLCIGERTLIIEDEIQNLKVKTRIIKDFSKMIKRREKLKALLEKSKEKYEKNQELNENLW